MEIRYLDAHTHAQFAAYDADRDAVVRRALEAGVAMVNVGSQRDTSARAVELTRTYPEGVWAAVGLHPIHTARTRHDADELGGDPAAKAFTPLEAGRPKASADVPPAGRPLTGFTSRGEAFDVDYYRELARDPKVVAIGECGLDYAAFARERSERPRKRALATPTKSASEFSEEENELKEKQREAFAAQIELAHEIGKPLMIHCRDAFSDLIETLIHSSQFLISENPGIIHFFTGALEEARTLLGMGFSFTFGGVITFTRAYDGVVKLVPLDRILSETDAPYVTPVPHRGRRNEPAYVVEVVKKLAELKGVSVGEMAGQILENARRVLGVSL